MPRKTELTWQAGTGGRQGRWRKKYRGRVCYFPFGRSKSDLEGYKQAFQAWLEKKSEIDAEEALRPKAHQTEYDGAIENWTIVLQWSVENQDEEHTKLARRKIEQLKSRLSRDVLSPLAFEDKFESLYSEPPERLRQFLDQVGFLEKNQPDPASPTTIVLPQIVLDSMDGSPRRVKREQWSDRLAMQRRKGRHTKDSIEALVEAFLLEKRARVSAGTLSAGRYDPLRVHLHHLRDWLGGSFPVSSITSKVVKDYHTEILGGVETKRWSAHYGHDRMAAFKSFVRWLWRTEAIEQLPRILDSKNEDLKIGKRLANPTIFTIQEIKTLLDKATDRTKLYLLLMLNTGMTQKDISDLRPDEVNWKRGTITRKRSKTARHESVPTVTYRLWKETLRLLKKESAEGATTVLVNDAGGHLKVESLDANGKLCKIDNIVSAFSRLKREVGIKKPLKLIRKTSATLLKSGKQFSGVEAVFLGHAPRSVADRHYAQVPQVLLDAAIKWLGKQYGVG